MLSLLKVTLGKALSTLEARTGYIPSRLFPVFHNFLSYAFGTATLSDHFFKTSPLKIITKIYIFILEINFTGA